MAFQFQSVAAVAPLLSNAFGVSLADVGILIGLYFAPGVALALPGGAIGQRFGDKADGVGCAATDADRANLQWRCRPHGPSRSPDGWSAAPAA